MVKGEEELGSATYFFLAGLLELSDSEVYTRSSNICDLDSLNDLVLVIVGMAMAQIEKITLRLAGITAFWTSHDFVRTSETSKAIGLDARQSSSRFAISLCPRAFNLCTTASQEVSR